MTSMLTAGLVGIVPGTALAQVFWSSVWAGLLALVVMAVTRAIVLPPALRGWLWWSVSAKLLVGLLPLAAIPLPVLPADLVASSPSSWAATAPSATEPVSGPGEAVPPRRAFVGSSPNPFEAQRGSTRGSSWPTLVLLIVAGGALLEGTRTLVAARRSAAVARRAEAAPPAVAARFRALTRKLDAPRASLGVSDEVAGPQALGSWHPRVLVPRGTVGLSAGELDLVLAHELAHHRHRDPWRAIVPALARILLWFHPAARLALREHALAREEACDQLVVTRLAADRGAYARLLVRTATSPALGGALAMAGGPSSLRRRLLVLDRAPRTVTFSAILASAVVLTAWLPYRLAPAEDQGLSVDPVLAETGPPGPATEPALASTPPRARSADDVEERVRADGRVERWDRSEEGYVFLSEEGSFSHGSGEDLDLARTLRRGDAPLLLVRRGDGAWIVRDPALLSRVAGILAPQRELGRRQGELGARQADLGRRQAELGGRQGELGRRQGELGTRIGVLSVRVMELAAAEARRSLEGEETGDVARERARLEAEMERLADEMAALGTEMGELGSRQGELGRRQGALGSEQGVLGAEQGRLAEEADAALRALVEVAIESGKAERAGE